MKERLAEAAISRNNENLAELDGIVRNSTEKSKALTAELAVSQERLQKQLEREALKANELTMLDYNISVAESQLALLVERRKTEQLEQPRRLKAVTDEKESEKKAAEKSIS